MTYFCICQNVVLGVQNLCQLRIFSSFLKKIFFPPAHLLDKAVAKIKLLPFSWTERAGAEGREIVEGGSAGFRCRRARTWKAPPHPWPTLTPTIPCPHLAPSPGGSNVLTVRESPRAATTWMSAGLRACTEK